MALQWLCASCEARVLKNAYKRRLWRCTAINHLLICVSKLRRWFSCAPKIRSLICVLTASERLVVPQSNHKTACGRCGLAFLFGTKFSSLYAFLGLTSNSLRSLKSLMTLSQHSQYSPSLYKFCLWFDRKISSEERVPIRENCTIFVIQKQSKQELTNKTQIQL